MNLKTPIDRTVRTIGLKYAVAWILSLLVVGPSFAQQRPAFESTVARVRIDVIVTDESGSFIEGLGADDFVVFEDGEPQEILSVELVGASTGATMRSSRASTAAFSRSSSRLATREIDDRGFARVFYVDMATKDTYTISGAQRQLPRLVREAEEGRPIAIRRRDETVAYLLSRERLEGLVETMELLANPAARKAIDDHREGKTRFLPLSTLDDG